MASACKGSWGDGGRWWGEYTPEERKNGHGFCKRPSIPRSNDLASFIVWLVHCEHFEGETERSTGPIPNTMSPLTVPKVSLPVRTAVPPILWRQIAAAR